MDIAGAAAGHAPVAALARFARTVWVADVRGVLARLAAGSTHRIKIIIKNASAKPKQANHNGNLENRL
jgi:hypothetical protein